MPENLTIINMQNIIGASDAISHFVFRFTEQQKATLTGQPRRRKGWDREKVSKGVRERQTGTGKVSLSFVNCTSLFATAFIHRYNIYIVGGVSKITIKKRQH